MTEPLSVCVGWVCLRGSMGLGFAGKIVPSYPEILTAIFSLRLKVYNIRIILRVNRIIAIGTQHRNYHMLSL